MYCKYCGQPIDDDSSFCKHCGKNIAVSEHKIINGSNDLVPHFKSSELRININKDVENSKIKSFLNIIWKIFKTVYWSVIGITVYIVLCFIMAPFIALFNADIPNTGISKRIKDIWKKEKTEIDEEKPRIIDNQQ